MQLVICGLAVTQLYLCCRAFDLLRPSHIQHFFEPFCIFVCTSGRKDSFHFCLYFRVKRWRRSQAASPSNRASSTCSLRSFFHRSSFPSKADHPNYYPTYEFELPFMTPLWEIIWVKLKAFLQFMGQSDSAEISQEFLQLRTDLERAGIKEFPSCKDIGFKF